MKKLIATGASVLFVSLAGLAQGTILLQNIGAGLNAGVKDSSGALIPAGSSQYTIELLAGTSVGSLAPFATPILRRHGWAMVGSGLVIRKGSCQHLRRDHFLSFSSVLGTTPEE